MHKIFENAKEPLFGRATHLMKIRPFTTPVLKQILNSHHPSWTPDDLLGLFCFTGGVAKYVQVLMDEGACTTQEMTDSIIREDSLLLQEGKNMLVEEFGKEYATYFTILSSIARGENRFTRIGGYWDRKGETEIDLIAVNERERFAGFMEIKRNPAEINLDKLREKSYSFFRATGKLKDYSIRYRALSLEEM